MNIARHLVAECIFGRCIFGRCIFGRTAFLTSALVNVLVCAAMLSGCGGAEKESLKDRFPCRGKIYEGTVRSDRKGDIERLRGIQCLEGNLVIGTPACRGEAKAVGDLSALSSLIVIEGNLTIQGVAGSLDSFNSLENLARVRRIKTCNSPDVVLALPNLVDAILSIQHTKEILLPALESSSAVTIHSQEIRELDLPALQRIGSLQITNAANFESIDLAQVKSIGSVELATLPRFFSFAAPKLSEVNRVNLRSLGHARDRALALPFLSRLKKVGGELDFEDLPHVTTLDFSQLQHVKGQLRLWKMDALEDVDAHALLSAQAITIGNAPKLRRVQLNALAGELKDFKLENVPLLAGDMRIAATAIGGDVVVVKSRVSSLAFPALTSVRKDFIVSDNPSLRTLDVAKLASVGGRALVRDNAKLPVSAVDALRRASPRLKHCGQKGGAPCSFSPPRTRFEALPAKVRFIRSAKFRAYASEQAELSTALSVLNYLGKKEKKIARKVPTIFVRSKASDAVVVVRGKKGTGTITEWIWLRAIPGRGYKKLAAGRNPKKGAKLMAVRAFVEFDEMILLGEVRSRSSRKQRGDIVVFRAEQKRGKVAKFRRIGVVNAAATARSRTIAERGLKGAHVGRRGRALEISFHTPSDDELPLVFQQDGKKFAVMRELGTALDVGETRAQAIESEAQTPENMPLLLAQSSTSEALPVGKCVSAVALPNCPAATSLHPKGPPVTNFARCRRKNGIEDGPAVQWWSHQCDTKGGRLMVRHQGQYRNGRKAGVWSTWSLDGAPVSQETLRDGARTGFSRVYGPAGIVVAEGTLEKGRRIGKWRVRSKKGRMRTRKY